MYGWMVLNGMTVDDFALAATTNDLTREADARGVADLVEFRMDRAEEPIEQLAAYDGELPILATNRNRWFGGKAGDTGRLDALFAASRFDAVAYVDLELETVRAKEWILGEFRGNDVELIVSHHDFEATPEYDVLRAIVDECEASGLDVELRRLCVDRGSSDEDDCCPDVVPVDLAGMTDRQVEIARVAAEKGYFEAGGASAADVAAEFDLAKSTVSEHLRAVTTSLFSQLFGNGDRI